MQAQNGIRAELEELGSKLAGMPKQMPYAVPEGYFEQLPMHIMTKSNIAALPRTNTFEVPANYFDNLPADLLNRVKAEKPATKVFSLGRMVRVAAAAVLLLGAGFGMSRLMAPANSIDQQLSALPDEVVKEYVAQTGDVSEVQNLDVAASGKLAVNELSDEEIQQYLEETSYY